MARSCGSPLIPLLLSQAEIYDLLQDHSKLLEDTTVFVQEVTCWGIIPITLTSGVGAYNWGAYGADCIPADTIHVDTQIYSANVGNPDTNANYEVEIVYGDDNYIACRTKFCRTNVFFSSITLPAISSRIPADNRVRARMRDSIGGSTCQICMFYRTLR